MELLGKRRELRTKFLTKVNGARKEISGLKGELENLRIGTKYEIEVEKSCKKFSVENVMKLEKLYR